MLIFGAPSRYYQGPNCLGRIGDIAAALGTRAVVVVDSFVLPLIEEQFRKSFADAGLSPQFLPFTGDVTNDTISRLLDAVRAGPFLGDVNVVIAVGGGKAIDVGKALCHRLKCDVITVPTAAANDAPTSKNYVIYDDNHVLVEVAHLSANPYAVLVDTAVIAGAPAALLVAGIGDAVTKAFEAAQCYNSVGRNMFGADSSLAALALAQACYQTLREHALAGLQVAGTGKTSPSFEKLLEAMFLMGGLGFESGGLSVAHAMTRGLSKVPEAARAMHGHQVAYGLLVQLVLEERSPEFLDDIRGFYRAVGLPVSLRELGVTHPSDEIFREIAAPTLAAPHAKNFQRTLAAQDLVQAMRQIEFTSKSAA
jgi:glycerol dehydrogenase